MEVEFCKEPFVYFNSMIFLRHFNPSRFEVVFLFSEILQWIVWINVVVFEFVHDD